MLVVKQLFTFLKPVVSLGLGAKLGEGMWAMEQRALKNVNNCLNTNIYSYLVTPGG